MAELTARRARLALLLSALALGCAPLAGQGIPDPLAGYLDNRERETGFSGAVLVGRGDRLLLRTARGWADHEYQIRLTPEHVFRIGSVTKPLTAMAALALVEQGRLGLDTPLCSHLSSCPEAWRPVAVRHLLSHTSGIPDLFGELPEAPVESTTAEIDELLARLDSPALDSEPGAEYSYRNFNYMLLGYVIEAVAGEPWEAWLRRALFEPVGMTETAYDDVWAIVPGRATGYTERDGRLANTEYDDHSAYAAGGLRSTLDDLDRFLRALAAGRIVGPELLAEATSPYRANYGYGWQVLELFGHRMINHSGGIEGFSAHLAAYPDAGLRVIVLSNSDREDSKATACDLAAIVLGVEPTPTGTADWLATPRGERCRETGG